MSRRSSAPKGKRQARREQRQRQAQQRRVLVIGGIAVAVLVVVGLVVGSNLWADRAPVGDFVTITPKVYENKNGTALGDPSAPVTIEVFEDFKCPACQGYTQGIEPDVIANLVDTGEVYYVYRNYPFLDDRTSIKDSDNAAHASLCAAEQNMFWEYHQMLFTNTNHVQGEFRENRLKAFAEALGLDTAAFNKCFDERRYQAEIDANYELAQEYLITGTPSVIVNGVNVKPGLVPSFEDILAAVQQASEGN